MALEATGKNIRSGDPAVAPYVQAKVRQAGPLWDQAARQVSRERGTQSLIGFGYGLASPQALLGTTEAGIREAQLGRIVPRELSDVVRRTAEREPSAIMSPEVVQQVRDAAQAMSDRNPALGGKIPEPVELLLTSAPTARNLQSILGQITEAQAMLENPAIQGYSGGGSPTEQQLSALLNQYNNIGAVLEGQSPQQIESVAQLSRTYQHPALRAQGAGGAHGIVLRGLQQRKDALRKANPLLDEYLNYQALKQGQGTVEDFLSNYYGKQRIPPQVP